MGYASDLSEIANVASILTAIVAVLAYGQYTLQAQARRWRLERYLKSVRHEGKGQKTVLHLMARLSMTEAEVLAAGFHSRKVVPKVDTDGDGKADKLLFQYR